METLKPGRGGKGPMPPLTRLHLTLLVSAPPFPRASTCTCVYMTHVPLTFAPASVCPHLHMPPWYMSQLAHQVPPLADAPRCSHFHVIHSHLSQFARAKNDAYPNLHVPQLAHAPTFMCPNLHVPKDYKTENRLVYDI